MLLKQSPQTPLCADIFAQTLHEAGIPKDVLQVTHVDDRGADYLVQHPQIKFVNFTGSIEIGKKIRKSIGESGKLIGMCCTDERFTLTWAVKISNLSHYLIRLGYGTRRKRPCVRMR